MSTARTRKNSFTREQARDLIHEAWQSPPERRRVVRFVIEPAPSYLADAWYFDGMWCRADPQGSAEDIWLEAYPGSRRVTHPNGLTTLACSDGVWLGAAERLDAAVIAALRLDFRLDKRSNTEAVLSKEES